MRLAEQSRLAGNDERVDPIAAEAIVWPSVETELSLRAQHAKVLAISHAWHELAAQLPTAQSDMLWTGPAHQAFRLAVERLAERAVVVSSRLDAAASDLAHALSRLRANV